MSERSENEDQIASLKQPTTFTGVISLQRASGHQVNLLLRGKP